MSERYWKLRNRCDEASANGSGALSGSFHDLHGVLDRDPGLRSRERKQADNSAIYGNAVSSEYDRSFGPDRRLLASKRIMAPLVGFLVSS
jgi:hypothetical protein